MAIGRKRNVEIMEPPLSLAKLVQIEKKIKVIADFISNLSVSIALTPNKIPKLTFLPALQNDSKYDLNYLISMLN